jgi:pimeloyl-ACP methyl ester carboxylesterase
VRAVRPTTRPAACWAVDRPPFPSCQGEPSFFTPQVVTELATEHPPAGLVLRSPFVDLASVGRVHYPFLPIKTLLRDRYPLADQLARVQVPTTVVYGSRDSIVPPEQSRAVAAAAAGETRLVEIAGADHNDPALLDGQQLIEAVVELSERVCQPPEPGVPTAGLGHRRRLRDHRAGG